MVHANQVAARVSRYLTGACIEDVNHEIYGGLYSQMIFGESFQEPAPAAPPKGFQAYGGTWQVEGGPEAGCEVSGMWRVVRRGSVVGTCTLDTGRPFAGNQSQRITFVAGKGEWGVENRGLNRWGVCFAADKPYQGHVWARSEKPAALFVTLESRDGTRVCAEKRFTVRRRDWQRLDFALTPDCSDQSGRFVIKLKQPGSVVVGHAFLQPGEWGRFKGLPVRRDVAEALIEQGITVLRYGGSMVNAPEYRWKKMIGSRDRRPPYHGTWYPYSSDGWGIVDFVAFCAAAGFRAIPAFNLDETPQDVADFIQYMNGPANSVWGQRRVADGHAAPYALRYLELGNEERVDESYLRKFDALAKAIWAQDPQVILVVGDFAYSDPIRDPFRFSGAAAQITSLAAHQGILTLARQHDREVWFDVHIGTDGPGVSRELMALPSYVEALEKVANGAKHKVVVFEFNAGNHQHRRALANAWAVQAIERLGDDVPIATSANCLQPDGQNDNGWDQGLLFLNPARVWLQPPGYVTRMMSRHYLPLLVSSEVQGPIETLDVSAKRSEDGRTLVLQAVNLSDRPILTTIQLDGFAPTKPGVNVEELAGPLDAVNTADAPERLMPRQKEWRPQFSGGRARYTFAPHSFTVLSLE